ncbi:MAG: hypothetical protein D6710_12020 [Nitrospirae bacterium]|nr:MAG: hypothetical protein D6710_12020 [Nitrospirota bacterium]
MDAADAKLSTEKRKKLPDKSFCGPNRSFPAHDCPHVRAGFRLLNRAKVSSATKAKIRACLNRKNKQLNCGVNSDAENSSRHDEIEDIIQSEEMAATRELIRFLEEIEEDRAVEESVADDLTAIASEALFMLRKKRNAAQADGAVELYRTRSATSLLSSIVDELRELISSTPE